MVLFYDTQLFKNVKLLIVTERGSVTRSRSFTRSGNEKENFRSIVYHKFANYVTYIDSLQGHMAQRFEPWPEWLIPLIF